MGIVAEEDGAAAASGAQCGNLLARIAGPPGAPSLLLCAHLDTVALTAAVEPVLVDGGWENANDAILGADNKAAVANLVELARRCGAEPPPIGLELLFTVSEENALAGSKEVDVSALRSSFGYVFDHASPIGEIVMASPTHFRLEAEFRGVAVHAGVRPENGRSAIAAAADAVSSMRLGRLDDETTANVGQIAGGGPSTNVVPDACRVEAEARSLDPARVEAVVAEMVDHLHDGADAHGCDVDVVVDRRFTGYRPRGTAPMIVAARAALTACGHVPTDIVTGGASDANALEASGFRCACLANGTERNHEPTERVTVAALEGMFDVALALVDAAARVDVAEPAMAGA